MKDNKPQENSLISLSNLGVSLSRVPLCADARTQTYSKARAHENTTARRRRSTSTRDSPFAETGIYVTTRGNKRRQPVHDRVPLGHGPRRHRCYADAEKEKNNKRKQKERKQRRS